MKTKQIKVSEKTHRRLRDFKKKDNYDSIDDVIACLLWQLDK